MNIIKSSVLVFFLLCIGLASVSCGKFKFVAFKGPHGGFAGIKYRTPKLLGFKHHGLGFGGGFGGHGGFGGGFHKSGYEHHEYHESHHSGGSAGFGGFWGK